MSSYEKWKEKKLTTALGNIFQDLIIFSDKFLKLFINWLTFFAIYKTRMDIFIYNILLMNTTNYALIEKQFTKVETIDKYKKKGV